MVNFMDRDVKWVIILTSEIKDSYCSLQEFLFRALEHS